MASIIRKLFHKIIPPCPKCPYTLGLVRFPKSPCPSCKLENYATYDTLVNHSPWNYGGKDGG